VVDVNHKVAFLLERFRRRRSSPSLRQIALVVVSVGLAVIAIRAASRRKSRDASPQTEAQVTAGEAASNASTADNDTDLANESALTDRVQSEMSRHGDAPAPATGAD
jgi:cytoskeletal protein RodZ